MHAAVYQSLLAISHPGHAVAGLAAARDLARDNGESELARVAQGFRVVAMLAAGRRPEPHDEMPALTTLVGDGYDRYICVWAAWVGTRADGDGPGLRRWMPTRSRRSGPRHRTHRRQRGLQNL